MSTALWTADDVRKATSGEGRGQWQAHGVSIDSRTLQKGDLFVAISGPRFDGNDFVPAAFEAGAAAALVSRKLDAHERLLVLVPDTLKALEDLGRAARARSQAKIIAVTGSVGKTGTKEALKHMLSVQMPTHASEGSLNNHWGVPLSLSRMSEKIRAGVFEIGMNHAGEITPLVRMVRPHVALITTVEPVHLEFFSSVEAIAEAKAEIFFGLENGGVAVLNADNPHFALLERRAREAGVGSIFSFGATPKAKARLLAYEERNGVTRIRADIGGRNLDYTLGIAGRHIALNSLGWLAAVSAIGADVEKAAQTLATLEPTRGRGTRQNVELESGSALLIDESYNANPASMRAAILTLGALDTVKGRRIAVLGDMLELGPDAQNLHAGLAQAISEAKIDRVFLAGPLMSALAGVLPKERLGAHANTAEELAPLVVKAVGAGDAVMVKGSYGSRMRAVVAAFNSGGSFARTQS